ncbi:MAG: beta-N-acetylhexosaminidase [Clostridiales bacterium]|nr:beta-N-acetylhexosaminidase [Clostridiales bacterium]
MHLSLIPLANSIKEYGGSIALAENEAVYSNIELPLLKDTSRSKAKINIYYQASMGQAEYSLKCTGGSVTIKASGRVGAYYALQTLRMLGRFDEGVCRVPCVEIKDRPKYKYRGVSLDESRHFFGKEYVKKMIDEMFRLKLNVLHWHLSDDQGWRIEIKKYPRLAEIGSKRAYTQLGSATSDSFEQKEYGGYYTQEDIKEIVEYAAARCVNIMPEIDVPAHMGAAIAAYPNLACRELETEVFGYFSDYIPNKRGIEAWNRPVCMGKQESIDFILDVYDEVAALFPFEYFHIGGDECKTLEWARCPACQRVMKENGFAKEQELQKMLTGILCRHLKAAGKRAVGWNEILNGGEIDKSVIVQCWENKRLPLCEEYARTGGSLIMSNHKSFYFDMPYAMYPLKNTYEFSPGKYGITPELEKAVIGIEGELWTEWMPTPQKLEMQLHPRAEALAEAGWTDDENKSFSDFLKRFDSIKGIYERLGINRAADKTANPKNIIKRFYYIYKIRHGNSNIEFLANNKLLQKEAAASTAED